MNTKPAQKNIKNNMKTVAETKPKVSVKQRKLKTLENKLAKIKKSLLGISSIKKLKEQQLLAIKMEIALEKGEDLSLQNGNGVSKTLF